MNSSTRPGHPRLGVAAWGWWNEANHGVNASTLTADRQRHHADQHHVVPVGPVDGQHLEPGPGLHARPARSATRRARSRPDNTENLDFYAPTVNLSRDPRWGRNDETWSEDPTLTADLASQYVDGLQGQNQAGPAARRRRTATTRPSPRSSTTRPTTAR